ncbi:Hybrid signal transduction histidine kinase B [Cercospora zeina]
MPKKGGLVEWTLAQEPRIVDGQEMPAYYEILDLTKDPRWKDNQFVTSAPHFRYYCGLPLRTENEINIGALFLLDDRPRDSTSLTRLKGINYVVLNTIAHNIMVHMKTVREAHEKQRAIYMNMCMADFISPEHRFRSRHMNPHEHLESPNGRTNSLRTDSGAPLLLPRIATEDYSHLPDNAGSPLSGPSTGRGQVDDARPREQTRSEASGDIAELDDETTRDIGTCQNSPPPTPFLEVPPSVSNSSRGRGLRGEAKSNVTEADHQRTFDRAAYLLRQALDLPDSGGGGVVLLDTNALADSTDPVNRRVDSDCRNSGAPGARPTPSLVQSFGSRTPTADERSASAYSGNMQERVVLAAASVSDHNGPPQNFGRADPSFTITLAPPELQRMCRRHPRGKLYNIPEHVGTSLFDYEGRPVGGRLSSRLFELVLLRRQFPRAKQVIFVPMFHANLNRWTSCFAFTNSPYRVFSYDMDYLQMLSFTNAIKAEIVRLATVFADQQKSDFIGSVSHELRSPLHGILASVEFLQDTELDQFQTSCINTMDACAHTLLDTVAMVLDYSKVNTLKRKESMESNASSQACLDRSESMPVSGTIRNEPLFATDQYCDVARITEEVVDGLAVGHLARARTNFGFDDAASSLTTAFPSLGATPSLRRILQAVRPEVELVLDIAPPAEWSFSTQPGAIRRIVMNLLSNSLKYTRHGAITISLQRMQTHGEQTAAVKFSDKRSTAIKLTVTDTGQGISPEYLRSKIFTPFSQENAKAAGTGLGLSIVRSIVNALSGEIDIKSIVNVGTIVVVTLPVKAPRTASYSPACTPRTATTPDTSEFTLISPLTRQKDSSVLALQALQDPPQAAIYEPALEHDSFGQTQGAAQVHSTLVQYLTGWFGFPTLQTWNFDCPAKLLIVDEIHLATLLAGRPDYLETQSLQSTIVLCASPSRQAVLTKDITSPYVEVICKPFGPYKLARAISRALDKLAKSPAANEKPKILPNNNEENSGAQFMSHMSLPSSQPLNSPQTLSPRTARRLSVQGKIRGTPLTGPAPIRDRPSRPHSREPGASADGGFPFPPGPEPGCPSMSALQRGKDGDSRPAESRADPAPITSPEHMLPAMAFKIAGVVNANSSQAARATQNVASSEIQPEMQARKPRLLLVDDNRLNLQLLHTYVSKIGYDERLARTAEDGQQAVEVYKSFLPDIVFMDLSMPIMGGNESARRIRRFEAEGGRSATTEGTSKPALIIALTGNTKGSDQKEAFKSGMNMYMTKPVSFKQVGKLLEDWMEQNRIKM